MGYNRLLVESGLILLNELLEKNFINNLYMFQSAEKLKKKVKIMFQVKFFKVLN